MHLNRLDHLNDLVTQILADYGYDPGESVLIVDKNPTHIRQMPCRDPHFVFRWGRCENGQSISLFFERIDPHTAQGERAYERRPGHWRRVTDDGVVIREPDGKRASSWINDIVDSDRPKATTVLSIISL